MSWEDSKVSIQLWKKVCSEMNVEIKLLLGNWKYILGEIVFQWTFLPFVYKNKKFYTVLLWCRVLAYLVASQVLRIATFYSTQLTGPNYHFRELSRLPSPKSAYELLLLNFTRGVFYGCGDLIFSPHMIITLVFVSTYHQYGTKRFIKQCGLLLAVIQSVIIIALGKHCTVDIIVAWYAVNLVIFFFINKRFPELPDRSVSSGQKLPLISRGKEVKSKEEQYTIS